MKKGVEESNQRMVDEEHSLKYYSCEKCEDTMFNSMRDLSHHRKKMHGSSTYNCNICQYKTLTLGHLKRHKESIHDGVRYSCDNCDYKAKTLGNLKHHKESIHDGVRYSCDSCEYKTGWAKHLANHKRRKHSLKYI